MSLSCPKCGANIKAFKVASLFSCPTCSTKLKSHIFVPATGAAVIAGLFELLIYSIIYSSLNIQWLATALGLLISSSVFLALYVIFVKKFSKIELRVNHAAKP